MMEIGKIDPNQYLTSCEQYLQNWWEPKKNQKIVYKGDEYTIQDIEHKYPVQLNVGNKILYAQDCGWKPSIQEVENFLIEKYDAVIGEKDIFVRNTKKRTFLAKPDNLEGYEEVIRQIRWYRAMAGIKD